MHIIQVVRHYLGVSQQELSKAAGITQPDLCEMEIKQPYGRIDKYQRLSNYLSIPIHALVTNNCALIPDSFFEKHPPRPYAKVSPGGTLELGRGGEDKVFALEQERLAAVNSSLSKLVLPFYKLRHRPGYDILSFSDSGTPIFIEVKTSLEDTPDFTLTSQEYQTASKLTTSGETYLIYRFTNWGKNQQTLTVYNFQELKESHDVSPATYACSAEPRKAVISGITYWREQRGMSKGELADCLGIKTPHLWRYENETRKCSVEMYQKMSQILGVTIDQLIKKYCHFSQI